MPLSRNSSNKEIAEAFSQVASVYQLDGPGIFQLRAYQNAAAILDQLTTPVKELWEAERLDEVPGLGEKFRGYLDELFKTGKIAHFDKILKSQPAAFFPLLNIPGIGPKTAIKLIQVLKIKDPDTAVEKVKAAVMAGQVPEFSAKQIVRLQLAFGRQLQTKPRLLISEAEVVANEVIDYLRTSPAVIDAEALGSLRRHAPTVGDIDIAVATRKPKVVMAYLAKFPHLQKIINTGDKTTSFVYQTGLQIDVKTQTPEAWGSMLQHYSGSKLHNIHLRKLAIDQGLSLSENGIKQGEKSQNYPDEKSFYQALGLAYIPPELREDSGEIEAAEKKTLPHLVEQKNIKGDFHIHTNTDFPTSHDLGSSSVAELLTKAQELKYEYVGFSDHNPKQSDLSDRDRIAAVRKRSQAIKQAVAEFSKNHAGPIPKVFLGLEVDILTNGKLALDDEGLELLDYAIVSVHSSFALPRAQMTQRILAALAHPKVKILGHPTGRQLNTRAEIECDWEPIFAYCAKQKILVEINAAPQRLDLPDMLVRQAAKQGVTFIINTDSHNAEQLTQMKYGVWTARRGWCTPEQIMNTQSLKTVDTFFHH